MPENSENQNTGLENTDNSNEVVTTEDAKAEAVAKALVDLDALDKFKYQGKEMTPEELHQAILRQQDYTKKTQSLAKERRFYAEEMPRYLANLQSDLAIVRANPELAERFRERYPASFHSQLDFVLDEASNTHGVAPDGSNDELKLLKQKLSLLERKLGRVDELEKGLNEEKFQFWDKKADELYKNFSTKYPLASEDSVTTKALIAKEKGIAVTDGLLEKLFRQDHEQRETVSEKRRKERLKEQVEKAKKAKDMGSGGSDAPKLQKKRMTITEAAEEAIRRIQGLNR